MHSHAEQNTRFTWEAPLKVQNFIYNGHQVLVTIQVKTPKGFTKPRQSNFQRNLQAWNLADGEKYADF